LLSISALAVTAALPACGSTVDRAPLDKFLALSALLTGFDALDEQIGATYYEAIAADTDRAGILYEIFERGGFNGDELPQRLDELEASGIFDDARLRELADSITTTWYSGVHDDGSGPVVVTYLGALTWKALSYTKAPSVCGPNMGFWAEAPTG